jgi:hypothetical protein
MTKFQTTVTHTVMGLVTVIIFVVSTAHGVNVVHDPLPQIRVPCEIFELAEKSMIARVGETFYAKSVQFRYLELKDNRGVIEHVAWGQIRNISGVSQSPQTPPYTRPRYSVRPEVWYRVSWDLDLGVTRTTVSMDIDPEGRMLNDPSRIDIPDCVRNPGECEFPIERDDALAIARRAAGCDETEYLSHHFWWSEQYRTFAWVCSKSSDSSPRITVIVDANSGDVLFVGRQ